ncbi:MAG TPA: 23S rRNA (adenine(2503)-C(2))-methyltransferase RlmN [Polyangiaceae bacterium]
MSTELAPGARFPEEWRSELEALGEPGYRALQIFRWIHKRGELDPEKMTDLPKGLRETLVRSGLRPPAEVLDVQRAGDGTRKLLLGLGEGARVECVVIPMTRLSEGDADVSASLDEELDEEPAPEPKTRVTLCVSTQFGCAMGCTFCASGRAGLGRGLGADEIVSQVILARRELAPDEELKNLVFMGMGEPLHHYDSTARALRLLTHPEGGGMSPRRITVSTVGLVPGLKKLGQDFGGKVGLAVSLHAPDDATRDRIIPMNRRYPVHDLIQALRDYPLPRRRRITIEYTLIDGVNDTDAHAERLTRLLRGIPVKVNLIPMNPVAGSGFSASPPERVEAFQARVTEAGYSCFVRTRRGDDVNAACGQLALSPELVPLGRRGSAAAS